MTGTVWLSRVPSNGELGDRPGLRSKLPGVPWEAPYERHRVPLESEAQIEVRHRYYRGEPLLPEEFPEASAIYDPRCFRRMKQMFFAGAACMVVRERLADVLSQFDLGPIGLIPYTIYEADEVTPHPGPFCLIGLGVQKATFLPEESRNFENYGQHHKTGKYVYGVNSDVGDDDIALTAAALDGPDLWVEAGFRGTLWMSDRLAQALLAADFGFDWMLSRCRIVGGRA